MDIKQMIKSIWPDWEIVDRIGEGSFGTVYRAQRSDIAGVSYAAIKVTTIPHNHGELESLRMEGLTPEESRSYLEGVVRDLSAEIRLMESVKGYTYIVSIEDYKVIERKDEMMWYIFIRMELLTPLNRKDAGEPLDEDDVIKLGMDLCSALTVCRRKSIIHRDIKPENIFVNDQGDYKLGDFGVARNLERLTATMVTRKGTYNYMAPEVYNETLADADMDAAAKVDICSLGLVMYQLMNKGRLPFVPVDKQLPSPDDRRNAVARRMRGDAFPPPRNASPELQRIIMKACAHDPEDRFQSAAEMRRALIRLTLKAPAESPAPAPADPGATIDVSDPGATLDARTHRPQPANPDPDLTVPSADPGFTRDARASGPAPAGTDATVFDADPDATKGARMPAPPLSFSDRLKTAFILSRGAPP